MVCYKQQDRKQQDRKTGYSQEHEGFGEHSQKTSIKRYA